MQYSQVYTEQAKQAFEKARFTFVDRKRTRKGDTFIALLITLLVQAGTAVNKRSIARCYKTLNNFFADNNFQQAMLQAGEQSVDLFKDHFIDACNLYVNTCKTDRGYASRILNLMPMKEHEVALKAAQDVYQRLIEVLANMPTFNWQKMMIQILAQAYQTVFAELAVEPQKLNLSIAAQKMLFIE